MNEMKRLTQDTPKGASLILDNPKTDEEAREQVRIKFMDALNILAAYERTGLTPEEVAALVRAESEGRLYIAQYKEGDTVYRINTNKRDQRYGVHEEQITAVDVIVYVNGIIRPPEDLFHDKEAAEAALREEEK